MFAAAILSPRAPEHRGYAIGTFPVRVLFVAERRHRPIRQAVHVRARYEGQSQSRRASLEIEAWAAAIFAFTASRLKLAPFSIGGNSIAVIASFSTFC